MHVRSPTIEEKGAIWSTVSRIKIRTLRLVRQRHLAEIIVHSGARLVRADHVNLESIYRQQGVVTGLQGRSYCPTCTPLVRTGDRRRRIHNPKPSDLGRPSPCLCSVFENTVVQHWPGLSLSCSDLSTDCPWLYYILAYNRRTIGECTFRR